MNIVATWIPFSSQKLEDMDKYINRIKQLAISRSRSVWRKTLKRRAQIYERAESKGLQDGFNKTSELLSLLEVIRNETQDSSRNIAHILLVDAIQQITSEALPLSDILNAKIQRILSQFAIKDSVTIISKTPLPPSICSNVIKDDSLQDGEVILRHSKGEIRYSLSREILAKINGD